MIVTVIVSPAIATEEEVRIVRKLDAIRNRHAPLPQGRRAKRGHAIACPRTREDMLLPVPRAGTGERTYSGESVECNRWSRQIGIKCTVTNP